MQQTAHERVTLGNYHQMGLAFIDRMKKTGKPPCCEVKAETPEWSAWETYFQRHLGGLPWEMGPAMRDPNRRAFTAPARWPEWFDTDFARTSSR